MQSGKESMSMMASVNDALTLAIGTSLERRTAGLRHLHVYLRAKIPNFNQLTAGYWQGQ
jgi:hypothetical protein